MAERRPPTGSDSIGLDTLVSTLVDQHIQRLAEDGRSITTLDTYRYDAGKLAKFVGGVRVGEASPARLDAGVAIHADGSRADDGPARAHAATWCPSARGAERRLWETNPVRDVQSIRSKATPMGATALTADQLRELLAKLRASETCRKRDLVDPITLLIATGLRRSELLALR